MEKLALFDLPDHVYWLADFLIGHLHCTVYHGQVSTLLYCRCGIALLLL